jgi:carboxymethylenebutenolidase
MSEEIQLSSDGNFPASVYRPDGPIKGALIVIHEIWGLTDHIKSVAERFSKEGYLVLAPDLLTGLDIPPALAAELQLKLFDPKKRNEAMPKIRELTAPVHEPGFADKTLAKLQVCFEYLMSKDEAQKTIGVVGYCFGGTSCYSLAVNQPALKAAVPYYGHCDYSVEELQKITSPILAFYGENDESLINALPELKNKMNEAHVNFESVVYPDCGHAFFNDSNPFAYDKKAADDAWPKTLEFLSKNMV